jgi:hypothetical protein
MNKINPLYILLFSIVLFIFSIINLNTANDGLSKIKEQSKEYLQIANKYNALQNAWGQNKPKKKIEKILQLSNIQNANIITNNKSIKIIIKDTKLNLIDKFMNKILNETIKVKKFTLTNNSLDLEVGI